MEAYMLKSTTLNTNIIVTNWQSTTSSFSAHEYKTLNQMQ